MLRVVGESLISLVLSDIVFFIVDEIPPIHEVMYQIADARSSQADRDVRPAHTTALCTVEFVLERVIDV